MSSLIGHASHLARRAVPADNDLSRLLQRTIEEIPAWGSLTVILTLLGFFFLVFSVAYTLSVVLTLAAIEAPQKAILIPNVQNGAAPKAYRDSESPTDDLIEDPEVLLVQQKPITASLRTTIHHLTSIGGSMARWRGLSLALVYALCHVFLSGILSFLTPFVASTLASIVLCRWELGWVHIVMTNPSHDSWYRRLPALKTWKKVWAPTALAAIAQQVGLLIPSIFAFSMQLHTEEKFRDGHTAVDGVKLAAIMLIFIFCYFAIVVPAQVALVRVQASMLPEGEDAIVPFDRTFDGLVISEADGGSGNLSYVGAWKSFDKEARARVMKIIVKVFLIVLALEFLFGMVFFLELATIVMPAINRARHGDAPSDDMKLF